ncbi:MAG: hypothetical protein DBX47_03980 [Clostridiales bacterium]|nr:MAG: hypothetical protein DBX47_03980 [Clostridiales bacterium]
MKKIIVPFLLAVMVFSLSSCSVVTSADGDTFESKITFENLSLFCATNAETAESFAGEIRGIMLEFHGITDQSLTGNPGVKRRCDSEKVLYVFPGNGPWNWMDRTAVRMTDMIIDVLIEHFKLDKNIPVVSTGHSMGGAGALTYSVYSKHNVTAVAADSAVCDLFVFADYYPNAWRGYMRAVGDYEDMSFDEAVKSISPVHLIDKMKNIPYFLVHGAADTDVLATTNSDVLNDLLSEKGYNVTYKRPENMTHVVMPAAIEKLYFEFIFSNMMFK